MAVTVQAAVMAWRALSCSLAPQRIFEPPIKPKCRLWLSRSLGSKWVEAVTRRPRTTAITGSPARDGPGSSPGAAKDRHSRMIETPQATMPRPVGARGPASPVGPQWRPVHDTFLLYCFCPSAWEAVPVEFSSFFIEKLARSMVRRLQMVKANGCYRVDY
ncbi:hypothetical protein GGTG_13487 [Gaeumannomyces tritici R3-111a-1]|uniref:Uncharacterized protein n=1 Tax=Gaeumannomyces tritici (strain R3-111a-1) TaxID=644352 RepID=J3PJ05_GAET3|nr:hypothetical protein GGTG_13487 [Gaeumannomyces tritici R3-111a-1]EJT68981.1 hypothetical protein GGTG_13487 [Gaeumannomyces tritici R3-111a-1]